MRTVHQHNMHRHPITNAGPTKRPPRPPPHRSTKSASSPLSLEHQKNKKFSQSSTPRRSTKSAASTSPLSLEHQKKLRIFLDAVAELPHLAWRLSVFGKPLLAPAPPSEQHSSEEHSSKNLFTSINAQIAELRDFLEKCGRRVDHPEGAKVGKHEQFVFELAKAGSANICRVSLLPCEKPFAQCENPRDAVVVCNSSLFLAQCVNLGRMVGGCDVSEVVC